MQTDARPPADDPLRCRFAISPLWELQEAVRTLRTPARHGLHLPWLRGMRSAAAGLDLAPLWLLMPERGHGPDFLRPPPEGLAGSIQEELARVRATEPDRAADALQRSLSGTPGAADTPRGRAMLADPARAVRELADLLQLAWRALLVQHWPWLRALLEADVAFHARRLAEGGAQRLFAELHPRLRWRDGTLTVAAGTGPVTVHAAPGRQLTLVPSVFVWPEVLSGFAGPPAVVYPARGINGLWSQPESRASEALARLLGRGRATVLTALAEPATTSALAHRLGFAPSSVSAHLSALRDAGLLVSHRDGHQVVYERTPLGIALATAA